MKKRDYGIRVNIKFTEHLSNAEAVFRNVSEIHFGYSGSFGNRRIAFESDIHQSGVTYDIVDIKEFETFPETKKAKKF